MTEQGLKKLITPLKRFGSLVKTTRFCNASTINVPELRNIPAKTLA
ncbi:MAG: hypothetical protein V3T79_05745 [Candidatus Scalindua sediminis]